MQLHILYHTTSLNDFLPMFHVVLSLRRNASFPGIPPDSVLNKTLDQLASDWWIFKGNDPRLDANATFCNTADPSWKECTLRQLTVGTLSFDSRIALDVIPFVERTKRALAMVLQNALYEQVFYERQQAASSEVFDVCIDPQKQPSGTAFPDLPEAVLKLGSLKSLPE